MRPFWGGGVYVGSVDISAKGDECGLAAQVVEVGPGPPVCGQHHAPSFLFGHSDGEGRQLALQDLLHSASMRHTQEIYA
jgi:hypothetical protein